MNSHETKTKRKLINSISIIQYLKNPIIFITSTLFHTHHFLSCSYSSFSFSYLFPTFPFISLFI